jgi:NhaP-type Na+/H+ or K+/H+ antiporter
MYGALALLAGFSLVYSAVAGRVERSWVSGPIVFTAFGLAVGPMGLGLLQLEADAETVRLLAELTLALVLFTDASGSDLAVLRRVRALPLRLLLVGLPLTIVLGYAVGWTLFDEFSGFEIALLATMLAPTDAALGQAVVSNEAVPAPVRQGLNVESGLNDGICVPILFVFLALATGSVGDEGGGRLALDLVAEEIGIGAASGLVLTFAAVRLLRACHARGWLTEIWLQIPVVALALLCFASAQALGGSGFIACFVGGLLFGALTGEHREALVRAAEGTGNTLALLTWVVFGAAVVGRFLTPFRPESLAYAVLSLTLVRMLPVFLCLARAPANTEAKLFIGWFGPRGLASIVFGVIVVNAGLPNGHVLAQVVVWTVLLSILAHGLSANAWARAFGAREARRRAAG